MIINVPPEKPSQAVQGKRNYICWLRSRKTPETNPAVLSYLEEAEKRPHLCFISFQHGTNVKFYLKKQLKAVGDLCRVKNNKVVSFETNLIKKTLIQQIRLLEQSEFERYVGSGIVQRPVAARNGTELEKVREEDNLSLIRGICNQAVQRNLFTTVPVNNRSLEQRNEARLQPLARRFGFLPGERVRSQIRERVSSESQSGASHRSSTASASLGRPSERPDSQDSAE